MKKIWLILSVIVLSTALYGDVVRGALYTNGFSQITESVPVSGDAILCALPLETNMDSLNVIGAQIKNIFYANPTDSTSIVGRVVYIQGVPSELYQVVAYNGQNAILKNVKTGQMVANVSQPLCVSGSSAALSAQIELNAPLKNKTTELSYLVNSLSWQPIYKMVVSGGSISLELMGKIENSGNTSYVFPNAELIYGDISQNRNGPIDSVMMATAQNSPSEGGLQISNTYYTYQVKNLEIAANSTLYTELKAYNFPVEKRLCYTLNGQNVTEKLSFSTTEPLFTRSLISAFSSSGIYLGSVSIENGAGNTYNITLSKIDYVIARTQLNAKTAVNGGVSTQQTYTVTLNNKSNKNQKFEVTCPLYGKNGQIIQCNYPYKLVSANLATVTGVLKPGITSINIVTQTDNS